MTPTPPLATPLDTRLDQLIQRLYSEVPHVSPEHYREWALEQLHDVIDIDAALWGSGILVTGAIHHLAHIGLDERHAALMAGILDINPIQQALLSSMGRPVAMSDIVDDETFFGSEMYRRLYAPGGITRLLSSAHLDMRTGLCSMISVYRFDQHRPFNDEEKYCLDRLLPHLRGAASTAYFTHPELRSLMHAEYCSALCDTQGFYREAQERFLNLIDTYFVDHKGMKLPFAITGAPAEFTLHGLTIKILPVGTLVIVYLKPAHLLENLSSHEREVVHCLLRGLSHEETATRLGMTARSLTHQHLRIYRKSGVTGRDALLALLASGQ